MRVLFVTLILIKKKKISLPFEIYFICNINSLEFISKTFISQLFWEQKLIKKMLKQRLVKVY